MTDPEHEHHFPLITRWSGNGPPYYQYIVGRGPCECGRTWHEHIAQQATDPLANARAAFRARRARDEGWR